MRSDDAQFRASEARRLLDEPLLVEALTTLESDAFETALRCPSWHIWGRRKRDAQLLRVDVIRDLRSRLETLIAVGEQAARRG